MASSGEVDLYLLELYISHCPRLILNTLDNNIRLICTVFVLVVHSGQSGRTPHWNECLSVIYCYETGIENGSKGVVWFVAEKVYGLADCIS